MKFGSNIILFGLLISLLLPVAGFAQQEPPPYPTAYWIRGGLSVGDTGLTDLSGFTVIFYSTSGAPWSAYATAVSDASGNFLINAHDDLRLLPLLAGDYFMGAGARTINGTTYGVSQQTQALSVDNLAGGNISGIALTLERDWIWAPGTLQVLITALPAGSVNRPYTANLQATGGTPPYTWSIADGALPPGLSLSGGIISGNPTTAGLYEFSVRLADSAGSGVDQAMSILISDSVIDVSAGPQIRVSLLLQALVNTATWGNAVAPTIRVEARSGASADQARTLVGYADLVLNEDNNTTGRNGFLKPDGTEFSAAEPLADGAYFLAIKEKPAPELIGLGHLSVITNRAVNLRTGTTRDDATTYLDLTNNPAVTEDVMNLTYRETPYQPAGKPAAMFSLGGRNLMRAGDLDGNGYIDVADKSHWFRLFTRFNALGSADSQPADPYGRADLDKNGIVDVIDNSWWFGSFNNLTLQQNDPGPHGYVPEITVP